jgi:hypothetical protein
MAIDAEALDCHSGFMMSFRTGDGGAGIEETLGRAIWTCPFWLTGRLLVRPRVGDG